MPPKAPSRWITALIAHSSQNRPALPWERAAKVARRKAAANATLLQRKPAYA
jgi:hypothetical protein